MASCKHQNRLERLAPTTARAAEQEEWIMRWSPHNESLNVAALTANARSILALDDRSRFFELDRTGRVLSDRLWPGAVAAVLRESELLVADASERVWRADPARFDPRDADLIATRVGQVRALASDERNGLLALVGPCGRTPVPARPGLRRRAALVRIDPNIGATPVEVRLPMCTGLALHPEGAVAYVATAAGTLLVVDLNGQAVSVLVHDLVRPGACAWVSSGRVLGVAEADDRMALVDVASGEVRRLQRAASGVTGLAAHDELLITGSRRGTWWLPLAEADLRRVHLYDPAGPIYRGGYARLDLDIGLSGISRSDIKVEQSTQRSFLRTTTRTNCVSEPPHDSVQRGIPLLGQSALDRAYEDRLAGARLRRPVERKTQQ
jgi:sugar lactone lactonase YvrE